MKISILGTRGSRPTSNPESVHYGGSTPCVMVSSGDDRIILDAGTGIVNMKYSIAARKKEYHIFLTHLHMDHIQGLGFFEPLFKSDTEVHIWGPISSNYSLIDRLKRFLSPPLFPVSLRDVPCKLEIHELGNEETKLGTFTITTRFVSHPGATIAYRVSDGKSVMAYMPDHEPMIGSRTLYDDVQWLSGYDLAKDADLLIHDAQYTSAEYADHVGWGHSSLSQAAQLAAKANAKSLLLFHHDPSHDDASLTRLFENFIKRNSYDFPIQLAIQGEEIVI